MKEKCRHIMEKFYNVDKNRLLPVNISLHLMTCAECRKRVRMLTKAEKLVCADLKQKIDVDSEEITRIVNNAMKQQKDFIKVSFRSWGFSGAAILFFCVFLSIVSQDTAPLIQFAVNTFTGLSLSFYIMSFIASNLDIFVKKTHKFSNPDLLSM
ncbi:MAG: hypothetical protein K6C98_03995 [Treponema sp.]|nr:hypothetical protein [Treponema sp.]